MYQGNPPTIAATKITHEMEGQKYFIVIDCDHILVKMSLKMRKKIHRILYAGGFGSHVDRFQINFRFCRFPSFSYSEFKKNNSGNFVFLLDMVLVFVCMLNEGMCLMSKHRLQRIFPSCRFSPFVLESVLWSCFFTMFLMFLVQSGRT